MDVLITYCGEGLDVVMDTARAACAIDYPKDRYRVIILDDSASPDLEESIGELSSRQKNIYYTTRKAKVVTHSKAANLNHGLQFVTDLPGGPSEFVAVLDVDMIPVPHWLRALVPHLLADPKLGLANPPQHLYNIPDGDPLGQSMDLLFDVLEPLKSCVDSSWCTGSGFVVRRSALDQLGGVPTESINEDILTSIYLTAAGWKIAYVPEAMQWGLVPSSLAGHLKQHRRWCAGIVSTAAILWSPRAQNLTTGEKYGAVFPAIAFAFSVTVSMLSLIAIPLLLLPGHPIIAFSTPQQLRLLLRLGFLKFCATFLYGFLCSRAAAYHLKILDELAQVWTAPFQFVTLVRFFLSAITGNGNGVPRFTPSGSAPPADLRVSGPLPTRLKVALWDCAAAVHLATILSCATAALNSCRVSLISQQNADLNANGSTLQDLARELLVRAAYPYAFAFWSLYITQAWVPISYAIWPPAVPPREKLLVRDPTTKVAYPSAEARDPARVRPVQYYSFMVTLFHCGAFLLSWYI